MHALRSSYTPLETFCLSFCVSYFLTISFMHTHHSQSYLTLIHLSYKPGVHCFQHLGPRHWWIVGIKGSITDKGGRLSLSSCDPDYLSMASMCLFTMVFWWGPTWSAIIFHMLSNRFLTSMWNAHSWHEKEKLVWKMWAEHLVCVFLTLSFHEERVCFSKIEELVCGKSIS